MSKLVEPDVLPRITTSGVYDDVSKYAHGNNREITVNYEDYIRNEVAVLAILLHLRCTWPNAVG